MPLARPERRPVLPMWLNRLSRRLALAATAAAAIGLSGPALGLSAPPPKPADIPGWRPYLTTTSIIPVAKPAFLAAEFGPNYRYLLEPDDQTALRQALDHAENGAWDRAYTAVADVRHPIAKQIIAWTEMQDSRGRVSFEDRAKFITDHPNWPRIDRLIRHAEMSLTGREDPEELIAWFHQHPPQTSDGMQARVDAYVRAGLASEVSDLIIDTWINATFSSSEERRYLTRHKNLITDAHHKARLERLLWDGHTNSARRMLRRVDNDMRRLAQARIALITSAPGVDSAIRRVPASLREDPGLVFDRMRWRRLKGRYDSARQLLDDYSLTGSKPEVWWRERKILARDALDEGLVTQAYEIAANHGQTDPLEVSEAEFLAGWIALQFLNDGAAALDHFTKLYEAVSTPISRARGAYWAGRAAEAQSKPETARSWYIQASENVTTYYGQLALSKLEPSFKPALPPEPNVSDERLMQFQEFDLSQAARLLAEAGRTAHMRAFLEAQLDSSEDVEDAAMTVALAGVLNRPDLAVRLSRSALQAGYVLVEHGHPMLNLPLTDVVEPALVLAVARQESNFDVAARSYAGAQGLMQLMPATARLVSRQIGEPYSKDRLSIDPEYNIRLGSQYLSDMLERFDGHVPMALAAYNAGPHRVNRWIRAYGDPRKGEIDVIDWIERIPFNETRNYVQRVVENLKVYRSRLAPAVQLALNPDVDLQAACWGKCVSGAPAAAVLD